jgi:predicted nucleic acid-binding protein
VILLDTNVISEVLRSAPEPAVLAWLRTIRRLELWTCSIVLAELYSGVDLMPAGKRQMILREKMEQLVSTLFAGQILNFDVAAARAYGQILAKRQATGHPIVELDAKIAALATRNTPDFEHCGIPLINPWERP